MIGTREGFVEASDSEVVDGGAKEGESACLKHV